MVSAHDVAAYILKERGPLSAMKLQKLVYYSQAWSLVWDDRQLFGEAVEAWANGPVVRELYEHHRGQFELHEWRWGTPRRWTNRLARRWMPCCGTTARAARSG